MRRAILVFLALIGISVFVPAAKAQSCSQPHCVNLSWQSPTEPTGVTITGYNVYKNQTGGCSGQTMSSMSKLTAAPQSATTFQESGLPDGVTRCYGVTVVTSAGESPLSNMVQLTMPTIIAASASLAPPAITAAVGP